MKARFPAILLLACTGSLISVTAVGQAADSDFQARCSTPGVVQCVGFDNSTDISPSTNLYPDGNGVMRGRLDTQTRASGNGSLVFELPPPPHAGANIAGGWSPRTSAGLGRLFGQNSTFYVQFRMRFSSDMLTNTWNGYWKTVIFHANQKSCGAIELATQRYYSTSMVTMYTDCGGRNMFTTTDGSRLTASPPLLLQQGDYRCEYGRINSNDCFYVPAEEWLTFYYKVTIGTWNQPNSMVEAWVARDGGGYKQFVRVPNLALDCNADSCTTSPGRDEGYNNLTFTPYMTGLSSTSGRAGVTSRVWYDELIVSTQPIPAPASGPAPRAPSDLRVN